MELTQIILINGIVKCSGEGRGHFPFEEIDQKIYDFCQCTHHCLTDSWPHGVLLITVLYEAKICA